MPEFIENSKSLSIVDACSLTISAIEQSLPGQADENDSRESEGIDDSCAIGQLDEVSRDEGIAFHAAFFNHAAAKIPNNKNDQIRLLEVGVSFLVPLSDSGQMFWLATETMWMKVVSGKQMSTTVGHFAFFIRESFEYKRNLVNQYLFD